MYACRVIRGTLWGLSLVADILTAIIVKQNIFTSPELKYMDTKECS